ncbi:MAG TPA: histidinol-phosphate transaminase [Polyangiaceae bacterium]|nr:histidinol-phosphate transaminase [Polyangiaceae bacterium]
MKDRRITRAIVLAAGLGSRLSGDTPKPIRPVSGVPLLVRVLRTLEHVGIQEAVIVLGHRGDVIRRALLAAPGLGLELRFVENRDYHAKNGVSLLAAKEYVDGECLLTMSDHLYSPDLPRRLLQAELPAGACGLGVDRDVPRCFDIDDATKVVTSAGRITEIGKELEVYDAIDTGVFRIGPALIAEIEKAYEKQGDCSLSDGVRALAEKGAFFACDVGDARWIDVDTPEALERAEAMLRVFGDALGDEPGSTGPVHPEAVELFAPTWVRAAKPYNEGHFAIAQDRDVLRMMSNESPFGPSPRVIRAIVDAATNANLYPPNGMRLKERLANNDGLTASNVLLGTGSTELIDLVIRTFVAPGEEVLLSVPTFSMYEARTRVVGGIPVLVPMTEDHEHDITGLIRAVTERTKVLFLCTPNNPTGNRIPEADLRRLVQLGLPTVVDEAYVELGSSESYAHLLREYPNVIVLRTFSKAFGLAGLRLGYALGHAAVIELLSRVKIPWNLPSVTLAAAEAALEDQAEFDARIADLKASRAELSEGLGAIYGLSVLPSEGNFVLVDISQTGLSAADFVAAVLAEGILIRSLEVHHATRRYVRVTVSTHDQNVRCVRAFERVASRRVHRAPTQLIAAPSDAE